MAKSNVASLARISTIPETDIAYIAGLIDADGTITINSAKKRVKSCKFEGRTHPMVMVLVVNGDLGLIRWIKETIGAGCAYQTKTKPTRPDQNETNWNPVHRFQILGTAAKALLKRCRPYLRVKGRQADIVATVPMKGVEFSQHATPEQKAQAFLALKHIRVLNQRGKKDEYQFTLEPPLAA
jgi:hypothetical protein